MVPAVVGEPAAVWALPHPGLTPRALHIAQDDGAGASTEVALLRGRQGLAAAKLPAHDPGVRQVPAVVTHGAPGAIVGDLHPTLTSVTAIPQPQGLTWGQES